MYSQLSSYFVPPCIPSQECVRIQSTGLTLASSIFGNMWVLSCISCGFYCILLIFNKVEHLFLSFSVLCVFLCLCFAFVEMSAHIFWRFHYWYLSFFFFFLSHLQHFFTYSYCTFILNYISWKYILQVLTSCLRKWSYYFKAVKHIGLSSFV